MAQFDGMTAAVPVDGWTQMVVYRKDLFKAAGLAAPTRLPEAANGQFRTARQGRPRQGKINGLFVHGETPPGSVAGVQPVTIVVPDTVHRRRGVVPPVHDVAGQRIPVRNRLHHDPLGRLICTGILRPDCQWPNSKRDSGHERRQPGQ